MEITITNPRIDAIIGHAIAGGYPIPIRTPTIIREKTYPNMSAMISKNSKYPAISSRSSILEVNSGYKALYESETIVNIHS